MEGARKGRYGEKHEICSGYSPKKVLNQTIQSIYKGLVSLTYRQLGYLKSLDLNTYKKGKSLDFFSWRELLIKNFLKANREVKFIPSLFINNSCCLNRAVITVIKAVKKKRRKKKCFHPGLFSAFEFVHALHGPGPRGQTKRAERT